MALRKLYNEIKVLKVKELPDHVKPMLSIDYVKKAVQRGMDNYHAKYIETSSIDPLLHVCYGGMVLSYLIALPEERRHLEHQQHAKEHGDLFVGFNVRERGSICLEFVFWDFHLVGVLHMSVECLSFPRWIYRVIGCGLMCYLFKKFGVREEEAWGWWKRAWWEILDYTKFGYKLCDACSILLSEYWLCSFLREPLRFILNFLLNPLYALLVLVVIIRRLEGLKRDRDSVNLLEAALVTIYLLGVFFLGAMPCCVDFPHFPRANSGSSNFVVLRQQALIAQPLISPFLL
ncbi:hypothetical protein DKX38_028647 [Salix brachista]|uniref:Uncharacterized protein n=1 Tax=Salix brachista TaxID=2182728 RepID=A0A5N5J6D9_9ROSI|nr:hypothetical protein DKX38_028647 [Salix brachista]